MIPLTNLLLILLLATALWFKYGKNNRQTSFLEILFYAVGVNLFLVLCLLLFHLSVVFFGLFFAWVFLSVLWAVASIKVKSKRNDWYYVVLLPPVLLLVYAVDSIKRLTPK